MITLHQAIPARYFALLLDHLEQTGAPCRDALSAAQVRALNERGATLTVGQVEALLADITRLSGRGDLGLLLGSLLKVTSHDALGYAFLSCSCIDHLLRLAERYHRLLAPMYTLDYRRRGHHAELLYRPAMAMPAAVSAFYMEVIAVTVHAHLTNLTGGALRNFEAYLPLAAPAHIAAYRRLRGQFHFGLEQESCLRIVADGSLFDQPLPFSDPRALSQAEARCQLQLQQRGDGSGMLSEWITLMLHAAEDSQPTQTELARMLNMSERTLARQLDKEQVSFRKLGLEVRNTRARSLLISGKLPVSQIAYQLGYTDLANFSRNFKRLNGVCPSAFARQALERQPARAIRI